LWLSDVPAIPGLSTDDLTSYLDECVQINIFEKQSLKRPVIKSIKLTETLTDFVELIKIVNNVNNIRSVFNDIIGGKIDYDSKMERSIDDVENFVNQENSKK
jgi:hypothetical protein